jgi:hypothetical protein
VVANLIAAGFAGPVHVVNPNYAAIEGIDTVKSIDAIAGTPDVVVIAAPPAAVLDALSRHKAEIVALLRPGRDGWSAEDWQVYFDERAGIAEFDGGLPQAVAKARAFECCVVEWLNRNPVCSPPGRCLGCGGSEHTYDKLLPYGTKQTGHAWLHSRCREARHANRKAKAVAILSLTVAAG